jgi:hypothetical protein
MLAAKAAPDAYSKDRPFWRQQMNVESILTGIFTGVFTGVITAFFGLLFALKQFKAQRAFDRQLEWYERTIRALGRFTQDWEQLALLEKHDVRVGDKRATVAQKDILATLVELNDRFHGTYPPNFNEGTHLISRKGPTPFQVVPFVF